MRRVSVKDQRTSLKPFAAAFCLKGEYAKTEEITERLIAVKAADADIWRIDGMCGLMRGEHPLGKLSEQTRRSLEYGCVLSGADFEEDYVDRLMIGPPPPDLFESVAKYEAPQLLGRPIPRQSAFESATK